MTVDELQNIDPDSYVKGVEEGKRSATPSVEKQSEIIAKIDELLGRQQEITKTLNEMRVTLLVEWYVQGDKRKFQEIMQAEAWGESYLKRAPHKAQTYFRRVIEAFRMGQHLGDGTTRVKP